MIQAFVGGNVRLEGEIVYPLERVIQVIWPSSFWLMATDGMEGTPKAYWFIFLAASANVTLYASLGALAWLVKY
ncbi:MAG TPA: hypothetical protein VGV15_13250, partial [Terriglobales bacterium]|nr:hypothetical protein [Terriglobales bacterium]